MSILAEVKEWLCDSEDGEARGMLEDLNGHGCISGMVPGLIYYADTYAFYDRNVDEIAEIVTKTLEETGDLSFIQKLKDYDELDPLFQGQNKNLMAWFAFEQVAYDYFSTKYEQE